MYRVISAAWCNTFFAFIYITHEDAKKSLFLRISQKNQRFIQVDALQFVQVYEICKSTFLLWLFRNTYYYRNNKGGLHCPPIYLFFLCSILSTYIFPSATLIIPSISTLPHIFSTQQPILAFTIYCLPDLRL